MVEKDYKTRAKWKYELQMQDRKDRKARPITLPRYKFMEKKIGRQRLKKLMTKMRIIYKDE